MFSKEQLAYYKEYILLKNSANEDLFWHSLIAGLTEMAKEIKSMYYFSLLLLL